MKFNLFMFNPGISVGEVNFTKFKYQIIQIQFANQSINLDLKEKLVKHV